MARAPGFRILQPECEAGRPDPTTRQYPFSIIVDPDERLRIHQEEVFGPVLSVYTYSALEEAISIVDGKSKPLALYIFGHDRRKIETVLAKTSSGGVTVNGTAVHAMSTSMGFGGVGPSGMGRYKGGRIGFDAFSNTKAVVYQPGFLGRFAANAVPPCKSERRRTMILRLAQLPRG